MWTRNRLRNAVDMDSNRLHLSINLFFIEKSGNQLRKAAGSYGNRLQARSNQLHPI